MINAKSPPRGEDNVAKFLLVFLKQLPQGKKKRLVTSFEANGLTPQGGREDFLLMIWPSDHHTSWIHQISCRKQREAKAKEEQLYPEIFFPHGFPEAAITLEPQDFDYLKKQVMDRTLDSWALIAWNEEKDPIPLIGLIKNMIRHHLEIPTGLDSTERELHHKVCESLMLTATQSARLESALLGARVSKGFIPEFGFHLADNKVKNKAQFQEILRILDAR